MSLEDLYREIILDHYRNPRNRGDLPSPPALRVEGFNPLCGDEVVLYVDMVVADDDMAEGGGGRAPTGWPTSRSRARAAPSASRRRR